MNGEPGITGLAAPEWEVSEWFNLPDGGSSLPRHTSQRDITTLGQGVAFTP